MSVLADLQPREVFSVFEILAGIPRGSGNEQQAAQWVVDFARHIGVHPGIVVGRLQHDRLIEPSWMNQLKQSFRFTA